VGVVVEDGAEVLVDVDRIVVVVAPGTVDDLVVEMGDMHCSAGS
jgi:hypothetical protein